MILSKDKSGSKVRMIDDTTKRQIWYQRKNNRWYYQETNFVAKKEWYMIVPRDQSGRKVRMIDDSTKR
jgi:hypothetical protein